MGGRGVVVIDLTEGTDGMEKKEVKKEGHACRCEVCHCDAGGPGGCEAGAIRHDRLMLRTPVPNSGASKAPGASAHNARVRGREKSWTPGKILV